MPKKAVCSLLLILILVGFWPQAFAHSFNPGDTVEVINCTAYGKQLVVRSSPAGSAIGGKNDGDRGIILAGPQSASLGGVIYTWWQIRWADNLVGWSADGYPGGVDYLRKVTVSLPDLVVQDISVVPDPPTAGAYSTWGITVTNQGPGTATGTFTLACYLEPNYIGSVSINGLAAGSSYTSYWQYMTWPSDTSPHVIRGEADTGNTIAESNEGNNILREVFQAIPTPTYTLTITSSSGGTTSPIPGSYMYNAGLSIAVTALPASGFTLNYWELDSMNVGNLNPCYVTMNQHHTLRAQFIQVPIEYRTLRVYSSPSGVSFTANGVSHTTPWSETYSQGTSVSLVMPSACVPSGDAMYFWQEWSDSVKSESRTVVMNSDATVTGCYIGPHYMLTISSSPASGIPFTLDGATQMTQYNDILFQGYYTVEMPATYGDYVWQQWLEDGDTNRIRTVLLTHSISLTAIYSTDLDFSITALPMSLTVPKGGDSSSTITVSSINGFNGVVGLYCSGRPTGVWSAFVPEVVVPPAGGSATSALFISADWTAEPGDYSITVTGTCGTLTHDIPIALHIAANPPTCFVELKKDGAAIGDIGVGGFFDIYVGDSTDNLGIEYVRFLSDTMQDGNPAGEWTEWYEWNVPYGDWDASAKTMRWSFATPGRKEIWAEVRDDALEKDKCSSNIYVRSGLPPIEKLVRVFNRPYMPIAELAVTYEWFDDYYGIYDIYELSEIHIRLVGFTGRYTVFIRDSNKNAVWSNSGWSGANLDTSYSFEDSLLTVADDYEIGISLQGVDDLAVLVKPFLKFTDWFIKAFEKLVAGPYSILIPHSMLTEMFKPEEVKYWDQTPITVGKTSTTQFYPDSPEASEPLETSDLFLAHVFSPVELRVYDSEGRVTGMVGGQVKEEIPDSVYFNDTVVVLAPNSSYVYEIVGAEHGSYGLIVASILEDSNTTFVAVDIPTSFSATHQYMIDWAALSLGNEGVIVGVDSDGNGISEYTFTSNNELTQNEFLIQTDQSALYTFSIVWGEETFVVLVESNSTVNDFAFSQPDKAISFDATGYADTVGFCNVTIPKALLYGGPWTVLIDGELVLPTMTENATHSCLYFTYAHSTHEVQIMGTVAIEPLPTYSLTITTTAGGTADPLPGTYTCTANSSVQVTAIPSEGYSFDHWELDTVNVGSANPYTVMMDGNHTLKAVFVYSNPQYVVGDINKDGIVDVFDLVLVVIAFGGGDARCDLNGDGAIDIFDMVTVAMNFGKEQTPP